MYCKKCGKELKDGAHFCSSCGSKVSEEEASKIEDAIIVEEDESLSKEAEENKNNEVGEDSNNISDTMFCRNCGTVIAKNSAICPHCGYHLESSNSNSDGFDTFLICAVSFLVPIVGIILWAIMKNDNSKDARNALVAALIGIFLFFLLIFLAFIFIFVVVFNTV